MFIYEPLSYLCSSLRLFGVNLYLCFHTMGKECGQAAKLQASRSKGYYKGSIKHFDFFYLGIHTWVLNKGTPFPTDNGRCSF